jgi:hypothetical protein
MNDDFLNKSDVAIESLHNAYGKYKSFTNEALFETIETALSKYDEVEDYTKSYGIESEEGRNEFIRHTQAIKKAGLEVMYRFKDVHAHDLSKYSEEDLIRASKILDITSKITLYAGLKDIEWNGVNEEGIHQVRHAGSHANWLWTYHLLKANQELAYEHYTFTIKCFDLALEKATEGGFNLENYQIRISRASTRMEYNQSSFLDLDQITIPRKQGEPDKVYQSRIRRKIGEVENGLKKHRIQILDQYKAFEETSEDLKQASLLLLSEEFKRVLNQKSSVAFLYKSVEEALGKFTKSAQTLATYGLYVDLGLDTIKRGNKTTKMIVQSPYIYITKLFPVLSAFQIIKRYSEILDLGEGVNTVQFASHISNTLLPMFDQKKSHWSPTDNQAVQAQIIKSAPHLLDSMAEVIEKVDMEEKTVEERVQRLVSEVPWMNRLVKPEAMRIWLESRTNREM